MLKVHSMFKLTLQVGKDFKLSVSVTLMPLVKAIASLLNFWE